mgnify:CR=1 FL=1
MWNDKYTYISLMIGSVIFPFLFSFEKNISFRKFWKPLFISILVPGVFFIVWDVLFTKLNFWSFNDLYTLGPRVAGLPIEEWLFFVVIPYCSIFIYEVIKFYIPYFQINKYVYAFLWLVVFLFGVFAVMSFGKWYTFINMLCNILFLIFVLTQKDFYKNLTHFLLAFLVACIPMFIVNGVLTSMPVVEYNSLFFSNIRVMNIPVEDFSYFLLLMLMNVYVFEKFKPAFLST